MSPDARFEPVSLSVPVESDQNTSPPLVKYTQFFIGLPPAGESAPVPVPNPTNTFVDVSSTVNSNVVGEVTALP